MSELDDFKTNINLTEFAASCGFARDAKKAAKPPRLCGTQTGTKSS